MDHKVLKPYLTIQYKEMQGHHQYLKENFMSNVTELDSHLNWVESGKAESFPLRFDDHADKLECLCNEACGGVKNCLGVDKCTLDKEYIHKILYDRV